MRNFKKIVSGFFALHLLLIFQSVGYSESMRKDVTYAYKFAPFGEGINWEKYIPGEDAGFSLHFKLKAAPPQLEGEINGQITFDQETQMLSVQPRFKTDEAGNRYVGYFYSEGGIEFIGEIVFNANFDFPFLDETINIENYRIPIFGNPAVKYLEEFPVIGDFPLIKKLGNLKNIDKDWSVEEHFQSLLLGDSESIQFTVGIPNLFSKTKKYKGKRKKDKDTSTENDSNVDEGALLEVSLEDAITVAVAASTSGGATLVAPTVAEGIAENFADAGLKLTMGLISPLEFSGAGVYLDSIFATDEGQPVEACGLEPELGYYGLDPETGLYSVSTNYIGNLTMGLDLLLAVHAYFKFQPLKIELFSFSKEIAAQSIPIPFIGDKDFVLNFEADAPITFPVDVDKILETDAEFVRDFPRLPQWHLTDGAKARLGDGVVTAIAYSPDSCQLAVAGGNGSISLYNSNVGSGEKREFLSANVGGYYHIQSLSFNRDGTILASGGPGVTLWDVATGLIITTLPHGNVQSVHFSPDGTILASGSGESGREYGSVKLWDVATGTEIATLRHSRNVWHVRFSPDGKILATAANYDWRDRRGSVKLWNIVDGTPGGEITLPMGEHRLVVKGIAFSPDGTILATADYYDNGSSTFFGNIGGGRVRLWNVATGEEIATLLQDEDPGDNRRLGAVESVAFSPDGKTLAAAGYNLYLWNVATRTEIAELPIVDNWLFDITFSPDGTTVSGVTANSWRMRSWGVYRTPEKAFLTEITTLGQVRGYTERVRFGPDSKTLVSFDNRGARLWDTDTGKEIRTLFHTESESLTGDLGDFSPDGTTFALVFSTYYRHDHNPEIGNLELWDAETRTRKRTLGSPTLPVESVAFGKNGKRVAGGRGDGVVVWDVETGKEIATLPYDHRVHSVALSPNGKILAGNDANGTVKLWDVDEKTEIATLPFKTEVRFGAASLSFDPDNKMLAVGGSPTSYASLSLWNAETGKHITTLDTLETSILVSVAFSPDGKTVASSYGNGAVELWDVATETRKTTLWVSPGLREDVQSVHFSPDGKTLATAAGHGTVLLWDLTLIDTGTEIATLTSDREWTEDVDFSPDGETLATAGEGDAYLWNISDEPTLETTIQGIGADHVRFSPDGETLATGGGSLKLWNIATNTEIATLTGHTGYIYGVAFRPPDGKTLASGSEDGKVRLWDVESQTLKATLTGHTNIVTDVAFSRDGKTLASSSYDGTVRLWNITSETEIATLTEIPTVSGAKTVWSVDFSRDGKTLASGSQDGKVRLWDVDSGTLKVRLQHNYVEARTTVRFSPDGKTLASSHGRNVVLWEVATGAVKAKLTADTETLLSICFSPDGKMLASGGRSYSGTGGHIKLWDITSAVGSTSGVPHLIADINGDGAVNIQDLVAVAAALGETGENDADVNGDGEVNIQDLVAVAAALGQDAAAPSALRQQATGQLTAADVQQWIRQAQQLDLTAPRTQRGLLFFQYLLAALTPQETLLLANYPNPFNPETWIPYQLAKPAEVSISIYAIDGKLVRALDLGHQRAGMYQSRARAAYWDGRNAVGEPVASGVYFYTLSAGDFTATRKMLIQK